MEQNRHPLRAYRLKQKPPIPIGELAQKANTTEATVSRIELRRRTPSLDLASRLSAATDGKVTIEQIAAAAPEIAGAA